MSHVTHITPGIEIEEWRADANADAAGAHATAALDADLDMLADVLHAVVHVGAGVSFIVPFSVEEARAFWVEKVLPGVRARTRRVVVARTPVPLPPGAGEASRRVYSAGSRIVGTVQIDLALPPNQQHRAEVLKLLVHPIARRRGIARALMLEIEAIARAEGRTLLTLDTWTGGHAETLYRSLGYAVAGVIPRYARGSTTPELEPATFMYKELAPLPPI